MDDIVVIAVDSGFRGSSTTAAVGTAARFG
jgi:hypothetical protein